MWKDFYFIVQWHVGREGQNPNCGLYETKFIQLKMRGRRVFRSVRIFSIDGIYFSLYCKIYFYHN